MELEELAKALKIETEGNGYFDYLVKLYKDMGCGVIVSRRKALNDIVLDRIESLVDKIEKIGE